MKQNKVNIETLSTGARLRNIREKLGLTQQDVAKRLCLKVSTIRDIEEDKVPIDLNSIFLRGYVRSYAKLLDIPEKEQLSMMEKQTIIKESEIKMVQNPSIRRYYKKREDRLINFALILLFSTIILISTWWWRNYKIKLGKTTNMAVHTDTASNNTKNIYSIDELLINSNSKNHVSLKDKSQTERELIETNNDNEMKNNHTNMLVANSNSDTLTINFTDDCWIEVTDVTKKKLFRGLQHKDSNLSLIGKIPYKIKIGAPNAVKIQFRGKFIDLSYFIKNNQVAYFTLP